jgi:glycosyltransferase involved in cell wall biosynthesis
MSDLNADIASCPTLVLSGVNMTEGGILSVLRNVVTAAEKILPPQWRIIVLAHQKSLLKVTRAEVLEFPAIKSSWWKRMYFELFTSRELARNLGATVWVAMHDITPLVDVKRQYVYCHNPTCFTRPTLRSLYFDWIFFAHSLLYGFLYSLNIRRNEQVFVQQSWIRDAFIKRFGAREVTVARPISPAHSTCAHNIKGPLQRWIYPTFPRHFKNIEIIGDALEILERNSSWAGEVQVTITGDESRYARYLKKRFGHLRTLKFVGRQSATQMANLYVNADGLLFPSKLETWGLPITEAQIHGLPMLIADLKYAHETVGSYEGVSFFDPTDAKGLAKLLLGFSAGEAKLGSTVSTDQSDVPTEVGWEALIQNCCALERFT